METLVIGIIALAVLAVVVVAATLRRRDTQGAIGALSAETIRKDRSREGLAAGEEPSPVVTGRTVERAARAHQRGGELVRPAPATPVPYVPPDPETLGVARRQFLNRSIVAMFGLGLTGFGLSTIAFLWPRGAEGFGATINVGYIDDIRAAIVAGGGFLYVPEGRLWMTLFPADALERAQEQYAFFGQVEAGLRAGVVALYQTCPHLGCRVPECLTSQWFECPCHGSKYNQVGEFRSGPAPRGMDRFPMAVTPAQELMVDTGAVISGPPIGTNTTGQQAEGPHCIDIVVPH
jgi:cytochrome b6-f complex iron-sulfur subunit